MQLYKVSTGDTSQVGLQDILGKVSALQVSEAQRLFTERMPLIAPRNEIQLINEIKQTGLSEGAVGRAINLMIQSGDVQRGSGRTLIRIK